MRQVELLPGLRVSALGFGCAPVLGAVDAETSRRALSQALDEGITHFDLARSYGYGQAEGFVGRYLRPCRDQVTITTKFGITASPLAMALAPLKPAIRHLRARRGGNGSSGKRDQGEQTGTSQSRSANSFPNLLLRRLPITAKTMRESLERSLQALGSDYVDILLIHETHQSVAKSHDLLEEAADLVSVGKIRAFGISYMLSQQSLHASYLADFRIHQTDVPCEPEVPSGAQRKVTEGPRILFSPFRNMTRDKQPTEQLRELARRFPQSVLLCSMFKPEHIKANASVLR